MLRAEGKVVQRGRTIGYVECDVLDENGKVDREIESTCLVLRGEKAGTLVENHGTVFDHHRDNYTRQRALI